MHSTENLVKMFGKAGLKLVPAKTPINGSNEDIFQLDIKRLRKNDAGSEYFEVWPGHEGNLAVVQSLDADLGQVVLMVKEPKREFLDEIRDFKWTLRSKPAGVSARQWLIQKIAGVTEKDIQAGGMYNFALQRQRRVSENLVEKSGKWFMKQTTTDRTRHFLLGRDERQLFMCQLPRPCTSVAQAHECLKAPNLKMFEGRAPGRTIRQGEWFFVNTSDEEQEVLEKGIKTGKINVVEKANIGAIFRRRGKPHTADFLCTHTFPKKTKKGVGADASQAKIEYEERAVFVRGAIRHSDHKTVKFSKWRRVVKNNEQEATGSFGGFGGSYID